MTTESTTPASTTPASSTGEAAAPAAPMLRVVRGNPGPEEIAALVAVVFGRSAPAAEPPRKLSAWANPARMMPSAPAAGPGAWRASAWPV